MKPILSKIPVSSVIALIATVFFCGFLLMSIVSYPPGFSPLKNWMSDLGNPGLNPAGYAYFNWADGVTGLLLIGFYLGLSRWLHLGIVNKTLLAAAMACGIFSGIALAGVGYFNESFDPEHFIVSVLFFLSSTLAILLATLALRGNPGFSRATAWAGYLTAAVGVVFAIQRPTIESITILEWISVFLMLLWAALISIDLYRSSAKRNMGPAVKGR
ncbi:MAG: hypothetical protein A4E28_02752 [Methanocella sp. PtaU1.Bin125]|nr:MAG: hypothetical protein A4E28_02752 [Methanocella sp. PtaU1.Bin125]